MSRLHSTRRYGAISYSAGNSSQIILMDMILACFDRYRQLTADSLEAGGQLFARFDSNNVRVEHATEPKPTDCRYLTAFILDRMIERREIRRKFKNGLHYVGDWHTHPEPCPSPSQTDVQSFQDMYLKSKHRLANFLMVIVGTEPREDGLYVALYGDGAPRRLSVSD